MAGEGAQRRVPVITIDGPAAVGKGTVAGAVAAELGFAHLDSGRLYRAVARLALAAGADLDDAGEVLAAAAAELERPRELAASLGDPELGSERIGLAASRVARLGPVRSALTPVLHGACRLPGMVIDGRDMGTLVFPDADLKIFLAASARTREGRALARAGAAGGGKIAARLGEFRTRDRSDSSREIAPIEPAADARVIDTDDRPAAEVAALVADLFRGRGEA